MRILIVLLIVMSFGSCTQNKMRVSDETPFQKKMNSDFKDASKSPLKEKDLKNFEGLDFFKFDSTFIVKAILKLTPNSEWFNMKTTTDRLSKERVYGILSFELKGKSINLNVYQGEELMETEGFEDYLFLPFLDDTNGVESYGGGRYIDLRLPESDTMIIDFNTAYNPLCTYNEKYSCPIVPRANYIDLKIKAGVKVFVK